MALVFALPATSCSSKKNKYEVIKEDDPWYECTSFTVPDLYPETEYEYSEFKTIGATDDSIYVLSEAQKIINGKRSDMKNTDMVKYYEQAILKFSYDGKLLERKDYKPVVENNTVRMIWRVWISGDELNILEYTVNLDTSENKKKDTGFGEIKYILNGKDLVFPDNIMKAANQNKETLMISDIYSAGGYTIYTCFYKSWSDFLVVQKPDGTFYHPDFTAVFDTPVEHFLDFIPTNDGKIIVSCLLYSSIGVNEDRVFVMLDPVTGSISPLKDLYGAQNCDIQYANGKAVARNFSGFNFVDSIDGKLTPICSYTDLDAPFDEVTESELLYINGDGSEIVLDRMDYDSNNGRDQIRIIHLKKCARNPNAGKTVLTLSSSSESFPESYQFRAINIYNRNGSSFFIKYVIPFDEFGNFQKTDADIYLDQKPIGKASDRNEFIDLMPYLGFTKGSYENDYFANAIEASKTGDALYRVPLDISAKGIITSSTNIPEGQNGFTFDSYKTFVDKVCNGTDPMSKTIGYARGKNAYFTTLFINMSEKFIYDGKVHFEGNELRDLMSFVDKYGSDTQMSDEEYYQGLVSEHNQAILEVENAINGKSASIEGKEGAVYGEIYSFDDYLEKYSEFGLDFGVYGIPSFDGRGPMTTSTDFASVSARTKYPAECAEFIKTVLSYDVQSTMDGNPINRKALRHIIDEKLDHYNKSIDLTLKYDPSASDKKISPDAADKYISLLSSSYGGMQINDEITNILMEESSAYFSGSKSMDDVIQVMRQRIQTVLNENS